MTLVPTTSDSDPLLSSFCNLFFLLWFGLTKVNGSSSLLDPLSSILVTLAFESWAWIDGLGLGITVPNMGRRFSTGSPLSSYLMCVLKDIGVDFSGGIDTMPMFLAKA